MADEERGLGLDLGGTGVSGKGVGWVIGLVFAIALAVVVGREMSTTAMTVVVGVVCGVAAAVPASATILWVFTRRERQRIEALERQAGQRATPPVVVIQGGGMAGMPSLAQTGYWPAMPPAPPVQRQFNVVGQDDLLLDDPYQSDRGR